MYQLPVESIIPDLQRALGEGCNGVLQAPPGAGKTTCVPLALMQEPWLCGRRIVMLEPRRLAARSAAFFMAKRLGEELGQTVGYRIRMDTRVGPRTRIEVVTEGVLTRLLQSDPVLESYGLVIFDEFHERSLHADLGLALCLEVQQALRDDLRLLTMSATLDAGPVAELLGNAPVLSCEGRRYAVETRYLARRPTGSIEAAAAVAIKDALAAETGDVLVFLPGEREIRRLEALLREGGPVADLLVAPLYGNLPREAQEHAVLPGPPGLRRVVLATSIAETSLTIEGIRVVIDAGLMRTPRFDPRSGMTRLETLRVSKVSAAQRRGRAGRLGPGACYRLWTEDEHRCLAERMQPEMLQADLAPLALELARWGAPEPRALTWLDPPPAAAFAQAQELLIRLGALDQQGRITEHGRRMAELPLHPRLAHMALKAAALDLGGLACDLAALLSERDFFKSQQGRTEADLRLRVEALRDPSETVPQALRKAARQLRRQLRLPAGRDAVDKTGLLLALAYPDRIAQRRAGADKCFKLANGRGAFFSEAEALAFEDWLAVAELDGDPREARIFLAAPVALPELEAHFGEQIETLEFIAWDDGEKAVRARRQRRLGELVLKDEALVASDPERTSTALLEGIRRLGLNCLPWTPELRAWQARVLFMRRLEGADHWPDVSEQGLLHTLESWLALWLNGLSRSTHLKDLDLKGALSAMLDWNRQRLLDEQAPTHIVVPSGSRIRLDYASGETPVLAVRLQELFGLKQTPAVAGGRAPVLLHLLSPAQRPVQVTQDLAGFWATTYQEVRKELKGRYPKHHWPDDPLQAVPSRRTKRFVQC